MTANVTYRWERGGGRRQSLNHVRAVGLHMDSFFEYIYTGGAGAGQGMNCDKGLEKGLGIRGFNSKLIIDFGSLRCSRGPSPFSKLLRTLDAFIYKNLR